MKFATPTGNANSIARGNCRGNEAEDGFWFRKRVRLLTSAATAAVVSKRKHRRAAFTLVEVLAAMLFMAIVIPVVVEALHVASMSGEFATRKAAAARVADKVLNENLALANSTVSGSSGTVVDNGHEFHWKISSQSWSQDSTMELVTAEVTFSAGGRDCTVKLNTLSNPLASSQSSGTTMTGM